MADIELVIKISEDTYKDIVKNGFMYDEDNEVITHAIRNGTVLPEPHGRIIDEYKITKCEQVGLIIEDDNITRCLVTDAPTIIEAKHQNKR